jgi:hypothetical protein
MNNIETYQELLEFKQNSIASAQVDEYTILMIFLISLLVLNVLFFFINQANEKSIEQMHINPSTTSFLNIITPPQAGQEIGDDYFNNADLPKK